MRLRLAIHWRDGGRPVCGAMRHTLAAGFIPLNSTTDPAQVTCQRPRCTRFAAAAARGAKKRKA